MGTAGGIIGGFGLILAGIGGAIAMANHCH